MDLTDRHPSTQQIARWLVANPHLPEGTPAAVAGMVEALADEMIARIPDGPELTAGLRKLVEAKDCLVRAAIDGGA